ncbi:hypothetical protein Amal_03792 [Acetobacter malorum]|uniref:Uncharacterized protein n=1 Tax=Acetobacter malorum TaxID=178901 RepID=A0A177G5E3_9PROT|nr:hypothetical protein Amal_03792 [Acetobacter malorum]
MQGVLRSRCIFWLQTKQIRLDRQRIRIIQQRIRRIRHNGIKMLSSAPHTFPQHFKPLGIRVSANASLLVWRNINGKNRTKRQRKRTSARKPFSIRRNVAGGTICCPEKILATFDYLRARIGPRLRGALSKSHAAMEAEREDCRPLHNIFQIAERHHAFSPPSCLANGMRRRRFPVAANRAFASAGAAATVPTSPMPPISASGSETRCT